MRRGGIACLILAGALVAPAGTQAAEYRGETSTGHAITVEVEGSQVVRYTVAVPAYCVRSTKRGPKRKRRTVRYTGVGAGIEPDGYFTSRGSGRLKGEISGWVKEFNAYGRFKLAPHRWGRWKCISPRVNFGANAPL